jgi:hypothetical protein
VAARPAEPDQGDVETELPPGLSDHVAALRERPYAAKLLERGSEPRLVELSRLVATQATILADQAEDRLAEVDAADIASLAALTLPLADPPQPGAIRDDARNAWIFSSSSQNLSVGPHFRTELQPGVLGFGFGIGFRPSYVTVAMLGRRYYLIDGYHRAYGLMRRGITQVPALVRRVDSVEELAAGRRLLPSDAYVNDRPPVLADYLDADVAADIDLPLISHVIVVQALSVATLG